MNTHINRRIFPHTNSKNVYTSANDGIRTYVRCRYTPSTDHIHISTEFRKQKSRECKHLHSYTNEGVVISTRCIYNPTTDYIAISTEIHKHGEWKGGAVTNPSCSLYLGVLIAEQILHDVFKTAKQMPPRNPGFDFICGGGYKIDVKSACLNTTMKQWLFQIKRNVVPDYFLCLAFDNRIDLNPLHLWLIPGCVINKLRCASISKSTVAKWKKYELTDKIEKVISCCNVMKKADTNKGDMT